MAFWGGEGGCGDGWSLHLHFIVEGTEWGFLEGSLNRVGWLSAWHWMPVICNFSAQKSECFFLCLPPPQWMEREQNPTVNKEFSIHLLGIWMLSIGRLMDFTSVEPTRRSMAFRVVELMRCWTPCYIILVSTLYLWVLITSNFTREREREKKKQVPNGCEALSPLSTMGNQLYEAFGSWVASYSECRATPTLISVAKDDVHV